MSDYHSSGPSAEDLYSTHTRRPSDSESLLRKSTTIMQATAEDHLPVKRQSVSPRPRSLYNPIADHNISIDTMQTLEIPEDDKPRPTYKSFKKKFLKLRYGFDKRMRESNHSFEDEDRLVKVSRRLKEQNDDLRELLVDINDSKCITEKLRYDLDSPPDIEAVPPLEPDLSPSRQLQPAPEPQEVPINFSTLQNLPQSTLEKVKEEERYREEIDDLIAPNYFSPAQEEEYLRNLDEHLDTGGRPAETSAAPSKSLDRDREHYKDVQLRNPVSVYNWLKRNRPEIFLQENSDAEEPPKKSKKSKPSGVGINNGPNAVDSAKVKSSPKATPQSRASKRSRAETVKQEEILDDDGFVIGGGFDEQPSKNKRKREDEPYRPKGGSSKKKKRKTASGSTPLSKDMAEDVED